MTSLTKFLYRILRTNCKALFLPQNREFLQSSLDSCNESIMLLSRGYPISTKLSSNPRFELERAFREGVEADVHILFSILPGLLRYSRAAKLIEQHFQEMRQQKKKKDKNPSYIDDPRLLPGAMLISKLYYNEKELVQRALEPSVRKGIEDLAKAFRTELEWQFKERSKVEKSMNQESTSKATTVDKRRSQIFALIKALEATIQQQEARRLKDTSDDAQPQLLLDQILQPDDIYSYPSPLTYAVLYCSVINSLPNLNIEAQGIYFLQRMLTRLVVKTPAKNLHRAGLIDAEEFVKIGPAQFNRRKDLTNVPREVNFVELLGNWIGFYGEGMKEVQLSYYKDKRLLQARRMDGDQYLPFGEVAWRMDLSDLCKKSNFLAMNTPYDVLVQIADSGFENPQFVPYTLTLVVLPASIFQPSSQSVEDGTSNTAPYIEMQLSPVLSSQRKEIKPETTQPAAAVESESNSTVAAIRSHTGSDRGMSRGSGAFVAPVRTILRTHNGANTHPSLYARHHGDETVLAGQTNSAAGNVSYAQLRQVEEEEEAAAADDHHTHSTALRPRMPRVERAAATRGGGPRSRNSSVETSAPQRALEPLVFCRTVDLDRCLLSVSEQGVIPLTPTTYLQFLSA